MTDQKQNLAEIARKKRHLYLIEKLHTGNLTKQEIAELEKFEAEPLSPAIVRTIEEVAKMMGVSWRTVYRWKNDGMPMTEDGYYDLEEIKTWYDTKTGIDVNQQEESRIYWDVKIRKYKATLLELEIKKAIGELLPRDEVEKGRIARIIAVKRSFLALPTRLAPILAMKEPREIEAILCEGIGEIIDEFAGVRRPPEEDADEVQDGGQEDMASTGETGMEAAREDTSQPVG